MTSSWHSPSQLTASITLDFYLSSWAWRKILNEHRIYCNKSCKLHVIHASFFISVHSFNWSVEVDMVGVGRKERVDSSIFFFPFLFLVRKLHKEEYPNCNHTIKCANCKINREIMLNSDIYYINFFFQDWVIYDITLFMVGYLTL